MVLEEKFARGEKKRWVLLLQKPLMTSFVRVYGWFFSLLDNVRKKLGVSGSVDVVIVQSLGGREAKRINGSRVYAVSGRELDKVGKCQKICKR